MYNFEYAYIFNNDNVRIKDKEINFPIYMLMFIEDTKLVNPIYKIDMEGLK